MVTDEDTSSDIVPDERFRRVKDRLLRDYDILDADEVRQLLEVSQDVLTKWNNEGIGAKVGAKYRYSGKVLIDYLDQILGAK